MSRKKPTAESSIASENSIVFLQRVSFELITKSVELWRTYKETNQGKGQKIQLALRIHDMIYKAVQMHPDIKKGGIEDGSEETETGKEQSEPNEIQLPPPLNRLSMQFSASEG